MSALRIIPPKSYISVTETITDIIDAINRLVESGDTYKIEGDTYFKVDKFLGGLTIPYERALVIFA